MKVVKLSAVAVAVAAGILIAIDLFDPRGFRKRILFRLGLNK